MSRTPPSPFPVSTPVLCAILLLAGCGGGDPGDAGSAARGAPPATPSTSELGAPVPGTDAFQVDRYREDVRILSSDEFEGRAPASRGEELTVEYLTREFRAAGLQPGNGESWTQEVPLVAIRVVGAPPLAVVGPDGTRELAYGRDQVAWTKRVVEAEGLTDSELVFVGYGIVAPEYGWNDYEGIDMAGKTAVILVNDPGFATQDPSVFRGNAMTYYGRWTYKYEEAMRQGAAGALIIHETGPAGYPWEVVSGGWTGPQFDLVAADDNMGRIPVEGWITEGAAADLLGRAGHELAGLKQAALSRDFRPVSLGLTASIQLENELRRSTSSNVLALLPGRDRPDEVVVFMAHWDHLGRTPGFVEDAIFNGAFDNATGTAGLLEMARVMGSLPGAERPARSVLFLAVTAEEQGLLGSAWYAANPVFPRSRTVGAVNMDGMNVDGPMRDITVIGRGNSELDLYLEAAARDEGRSVRDDPEPEKGFFYRSDHFSFAREGIPALYTDSGIDHVEHGEAWTMERRADYTANRYHKPSDEFDPSWDLAGAVDDLRLLYRVGYRMANGTAWPNWMEGNEFRARREREMPGR